MPLHIRILLGLILGGLAGVATNLITQDGPYTERFVSLVTEPIGKIWLSCLIMTVIPLIVSSLALGVAGLGDLRKLGRMGALTLACFLSLTTLSTSLGLITMNYVRPGEDLDPAVKTRLLETYRGQTQEAMGLSGTIFSVDLLVNIVPRNPVKAAADGNMLAIIFCTLVLGIALASLPGEQTRPLVELLESVGRVTVAVIHGVMTFGPLGVFCLIYSVTARFGFDLLLNLAKYVLTVIGSFALMQIVGYGLIVRFVAGRNPREFFHKIRLVMLTAFSTSSSNATLPTTMEVAQDELGTPRQVAGFVLPLGATLNMNGTALYEGATVLFLAQVFGVSLSLGQQAIVVLMSVVTAIGVAGVPGASLPLLMMVLGMVGVPMEGIAIILGIDRLLDMCRTVLNVTGDLLTALIVARFETRFEGVSGEASASVAARQGKA